MALTGGQSVSSGGSQGTSASNSWSQTNGTAATQASINNANSANAWAQQQWQQAAAYNSEEAAKQRAWQERMANTVYQRTVKDMMAAGINPVLAANMGLGTASVGSGATASMNNPTTYMASAFPDSQSASAANSQNSSWSSGESLSGIAYLADVIGGVISKMNGGTQISIALDGLKNLWNNDNNNDGKKDIDDKIDAVAAAAAAATGQTTDAILNMFNGNDGSKIKAVQTNTHNAYSYDRDWYKHGAGTWINSFY